jgi:hypothetical protein
VALARLVPIACLVVLAGCGATVAHQRTQPTVSPLRAERQWIDNAGRLIDDLQESVLLSASGGSDLASARKALHDDSDLYGMLVAHTRFGGCRQTLLNAGTPDHRLRQVDRTLTTACHRLERASDLFTVSIKRSDPGVLLSATRAALKAAPLLERAKVELDAVRVPTVAR